MLRIPLYFSVVLSNLILIYLVIIIVTFNNIYNHFILIDIFQSLTERIYLSLQTINGISRYF